MSAATNVPAMIPPAVYPIGVGLLATSSMFFGNIGLSICGPLPIIKEQLGSSTLSTRQRLRVWRLFFDEAAKYIIAGTGLTTALHLSVPFLTQSHTVRNLAIASALLSALALPYTGVVIVPTNRALIALDDSTELSESEEKRAGELIENWDRLHKVRCIIYGGGWATCVAALVAAFAAQG